MRLRISHPAGPGGSAPGPPVTCKQWARMTQDAVSTPITSSSGRIRSRPRTNGCVGDQRYTQADDSYGLTTVRRDQVTCPRRGDRLRLPGRERAAVLQGTSKAARKRASSRAVREVANHLGTTPAVCRASSIDPRLFELFDEGRTIGAALPDLEAFGRLGGRAQYDDEISSAGVLLQDRPEHRRHPIHRGGVRGRHDPAQSRPPRAVTRQQPDPVLGLHDVRTAPYRGEGPRARSFRGVRPPRHPPRTPAGYRQPMRRARTARNPERCPGPSRPPSRSPARPRGVRDPWEGCAVPGGVAMPIHSEPLHGSAQPIPPRWPRPSGIATSPRCPTELPAHPDATATPPTPSSEPPRRIASPRSGPYLPLGAGL